MLRRVILLAGVLTLLLTAGTALAGGWVVITLETMPEQIRSDEAAQFSFMVRQHGKTPTHDVKPVLTATNAETGEQLQVNAEPALELGRFMVEVNFPSAGAWDWSISAEPFPQTATFAPLTVLATEPAALAKQADRANDGSLTAGTQQIDQAGFNFRPLLRLAGLVLLAAALLLFALDRWRGRGTIASTPIE